MTELFAPPGNRWQAVSPALARMRRTVLGGVAALLIVFLIVGGLIFDLPAWLVVAAPLLVVVLASAGIVLIGRNAQSWGYAERDDDLFIKHGVMFRSLVCVPYGRMQYVDVNAGPIEQAYGIASVYLHTASPGTSARIPGLGKEEAARLRDRLTSQGRAEAAGL